MTKPRSFFEHRFIDGKPVGLRTTVERLKYLGWDGGPIYEPTEAEKWKTATVLALAVALVAVGLYFGWFH